MGCDLLFFERSVSGMLFCKSEKSTVSSTPLGQATYCVGQQPVLKPHQQVDDR